MVQYDDLPIIWEPDDDPLDDLDLELSLELD